MEGFSAFLGKAEFSEPAYWTDEDGITLRKPSEMHYRQHGREHCFSKLLDRNQKLVYSLDETLLDRYALLSETILLEPSLATDCLEYVKELYYQEDAPIFDTLFPVIEAMLAKKNPLRMLQRWYLWDSKGRDWSKLHSLLFLSVFSQPPVLLA